MGEATESSEASVSADVVAGVYSERSASPLRVVTTPRVWLAQPDDDGVIPLVVLHGCNPELVDDIADHVVSQGGELFRRALVFPAEVDIRWLGDSITETAGLAASHLAELADMSGVEVREL